MSDRHELFELPESEADDIDTLDDLERVRRHVGAGLIIFRVQANQHVGTGHLHHCLQLAEHAGVHRVLFLLKNCDDFVSQMLKQSGWDFETEDNLERCLAAHTTQPGRRQ